MSSRTVTVYRDAPGGGVDKIEVLRKVDGVTEHADEATLRGPGLTEGVNYHERIKRTYYALECAGKLGDMSPRAKAYVRDVHTHAQNPAYWPDGE